MACSGALQWWQEWQLRVLVLGSLGVQCYLALFASSRKKLIRPLYRLLIWLAYLGGDALAIYALATLFNRKKKSQDEPVNCRRGDVNESRDLEVLWAPILRMHLGGQLTISAYNIEDNELWHRHILTAVAQVAVVLYVFCKSWSPSANKRLLAAAILLFIIGIFKCFDKPSALKRASFNSIVTTFHPAPRTKTVREVELEEYIQEARSFVQQNKNTPALDSDSRSPHKEQLSMPDKLIVDYTYVYGDRLIMLKPFWLLREKTTYKALRVGLSKTFNLIYSKEFQGDDRNRTTPAWGNTFSGLLQFLDLLFPIVPIGLFHSSHSHKKAYRATDIKTGLPSIYSLIGYLARNTRHTRLMGIAEFFQCKDVESYWRFSDSRGQLTLEGNGREEILRGSIEKPLDESIILWHVATDFCFYYSKKNLFTVAYHQLEAILRGDDVSQLDQRRVTLRIINKARKGKLPEDFIRDSWVLVQELMRLGDKKKMWEVIKAVWIEMLCFSAGRCWGNLHAKSLGSGGEFLSYISLLMSHAGLETYAEGQQRGQLRLPKEARQHIVRVKAMKKEIRKAARNMKHRMERSVNASGEVQIVIS